MLGLIGKERFDFQDLLDILAVLRGENGCPWDREQTHQSIKKNFIEEVYEAIEGIETGDDVLLCEELGDVLLQVAFHAQMAKEEGRFSMDEVTDGICKKLILRHPHIFGDVSADTSQAVLKNWDEIKRKEKGHTSHTQVMRGISKSLPALMRSDKIQRKAKKAGFDWDTPDGAFLKLYEETAEAFQALREKNAEHLSEEVGDLLFAAVNVARMCEIEPEEALSKACDKFIHRFSYVEENAQACYGKPFELLTLTQMDNLWEDCKAKDKTNKT